MNEIIFGYSDEGRRYFIIEFVEFYFFLNVWLFIGDLYKIILLYIVYKGKVLIFT